MSCNVECKIRKVSIEKIEELLKTKKNNPRKCISIQEIVDLEHDLTIPEEFNFRDSKILISSLKRLISIKKRYNVKTILIRELEATEKKWIFSIRRHWTKKGNRFHDYPRIKICPKEEKRVKDLVFLLLYYKKMGVDKKIDSRIDDIIEEFCQIEYIFEFSEAHFFSKIFDEAKNETKKVSISCLRLFQLYIEKLIPAVNIAETYIRGETVFEEKETTLFKSDYLFIKAITARIMEVIDQIGD